MEIGSDYIIKNIASIYDKYQIMPQLGLHMLRVASVGALIYDSWQGPEIHKKDIVAVLLIHDLGNIVKFTGLDEHWEGIRQSIIKKYGMDDHEATNKIAMELGVEPRLYYLLEKQGNLLGNKDLVLSSDDYDLKICCYCDWRAAPYGIVSITERLNNLIERKRGLPVEKIYASLKESVIDLEKQVFSNTSIKPESITNESVNTKVNLYGKDWLKNRSHGNKNVSKS
jgi:hypothetical protein